MSADKETWPDLAGRIIEDAGFRPARRYQDYNLEQQGDGGCPCCRRQQREFVETLA